QVLNFCITTTGGLLVLSFKVDGDSVPFGKAFLPFVSLFPFSVILASIILAESLLNSTVRIASYLKLVYEKDGTIHWQTSMQRSRSNENLRRFRKGLSSTFTVLMLVCVISSGVSLTWVLSEKVGNILWYLTGYVAVLLGLGRASWKLMSKLTHSFSRDYF